MYVIDRCAEEDLEAVVQLSINWAGENNVYGMAPNELDDLRGRMNGYFWIARYDAEVVGYIFGTEHRSEGLAVIPAGESYIEIDEVYVSPGHRSAGIGHQLVDRLLLEAGWSGITRSVVHSAAKDWRRIVGFYEKHDFQMWFVQMVR
jgi:GNAT superfamily N-acetyltransferase